MNEPQTLSEAIKFFDDPVNCREYMVARRWAGGVVCPHCGSKNVVFYEKYNRWHCREKHHAPQFTLKTGTIFEDSPIPLGKWLTAMWMIVNCKNGVSRHELHRAIGVTQKIRLVHAAPHSRGSAACCLRQAHQVGRARKRSRG